MHLRAHRLHTRCIAPLFRERGVVILLTDRLIGEQRLGARQILLRILERCLRLREIGLRLFERGEKRLLIDDEKEIVLPDVGAIDVRLPLQNPADPRSNFDRVDRFRLADILFEHGDRRGRQSNDGYFGRRRLRRLAFFAARRDGEYREHGGSDANANVGAGEKGAQ